jgi:hypothetical protein
LQFNGENSVPSNQFICAEASARDCCWVGHEPPDFHTETVIASDGRSAGAAHVTIALVAKREPPLPVILRPNQAGRSKHWVKAKNRKHQAMARVMESYR